MIKNLSSIIFLLFFVGIANSQEKHEIKGKLNFLHKNILELDSEELFDVVFTIRCIINLMDWKHRDSIHVTV